MKIKRAFIKGTNWALAGLIGLLGFTNCDKDGLMEYGSPYTVYTIVKTKGTVVDKATGEPIPGILVAYSQPTAEVMYGVMPTPYKKKASVTTNAKGEYELKDAFFDYEMIPDEKNIPASIPVFVNDIDGKVNGLYSDTILTVNVTRAAHSGKQQGWYGGEYTVNVDIALTEQKDNE
jgi:putative lipoprotein (rSAM/lipoprotein system)